MLFAGLGREERCPGGSVRLFMPLQGMSLPSAFPFSAPRHSTPLRSASLHSASFFFVSLSSAVFRCAPHRFTSLHSAARRLQRALPSICVRGWTHPRTPLLPSPPHHPPSPYLTGRENRQILHLSRHPLPDRLRKPPFSPPLASLFTSPGTLKAIFVPARVALYRAGNKFPCFRSRSRRDRLSLATFASAVCSQVPSSRAPLQTRQSFKPRGRDSWSDSVGLNTFGKNAKSLIFMQQNGAWRHL